MMTKKRKKKLKHNQAPNETQKHKKLKNFVKKK